MVSAPVSYTHLVALGRKSDVVANRLAEGVGLLEHHANGATQLVGVFGLGVHVAPAIVGVRQAPDFQPNFPKAANQALCCGI